MVEGTPFAVQAAVAKDRASKLDELKNLPALLAKADLPQIAAPEPAPAPATPAVLDTAPVQLEPTAPPTVIPVTPPPAQEPPPATPPAQPGQPK